MFLSVVSCCMVGVSHRFPQINIIQYDKTKKRKSNNVYNFSFFSKSLKTLRVLYNTHRLYFEGFPT